MSLFSFHDKIDGEASEKADSNEIKTQWCGIGRRLKLLKAYGFAFRNHRHVLRGELGCEDILVLPY